LKRPAVFRGGSLDGRGMDLESSTITKMVEVGGRTEIYRRTGRRVSVEGPGKTRMEAHDFRFERSVEKTAEKV